LPTRIPPGLLKSISPFLTLIISEKLKSITKKFDFNIAYKLLNCMNTFIKTGKNKTKKEDHSNVVYKINCLDCNYSYVRQTKRKLKTRLKEHVNDLEKPANSLSVISCHKGLNKQSNTERFPEIFLSIIEKSPSTHIELLSSLLFPLLSFHNI